jgi:hypothetical protein
VNPTCFFTESESGTGAGEADCAGPYRMSSGKHSFMSVNDLFRLSGTAILFARHGTLESIDVKVGKVTICIVVQELNRVVQGYIVITVYRVHNIVQPAAL